MKRAKLKTQSTMNTQVMNGLVNDLDLTKEFLERIHPINREYLENNHFEIKKEKEGKSYDIKYQIFELEQIIEKDVTKNYQLLKLLKYAFGNTECQEYIIGLSYFDKSNIIENGFNNRDEYLSNDINKTLKWFTKSVGIEREFYGDSGVIEPDIREEIPNIFKGESSNVIIPKSEIKMPQQRTVNKRKVLSLRGGNYRKKR